MISANKAFERARCANNDIVARELRFVHEQIKQASALGNYHTCLYNILLTDETIGILKSYGYDVDCGNNITVINWAKL